MGRLKRPRLASLSPSGGLAPASAWLLPCTKLVLSFDEHRPHDVALRRWLADGEIATLARQYPSVEFVVQTKPNRPAVFKAFYGLPLCFETLSLDAHIHSVNGHARNRALHGIASGLEIWKVAEELLAQSGNRYRRLLGTKSVISQHDNARGQWSALHRSANGLKSTLPAVDGKW